MKSESLQIYNAPRIPKSCTSRGMVSLSSFGDSKQCRRGRGLDLSESNTDKERMRKKHKYFMQVKEEEDVVVSAEVEDHGEEVVVSLELVDTEMSSLLNIEPPAREEPSLLSDPLKNELERFHKETEELDKCREDMMSGMKSECAKEIEELVAEIRKKYQLKFEDAQEQYRQKNNGVYQNHKNRMNKLMADAFSYNCFNTWSSWSPMQQGYPSSYMQYHQNLVRPTEATQHAAANSRPWAINGVHLMNPYFQPSIPAIPSSMPTAAQNPDIRPNYAGIPPPNMPQTRTIPINPMIAPGATFGYHPQGCHQFPFVPFYTYGYYPGGYHQFPFMPSYPYSYYPQGYTSLDSSRKKGIDEENTDKDDRMPSSERASPFPPHYSPQGLKNTNPVVNSSEFGDEMEHIQPTRQTAAKQKRNSVKKKWSS